MTSFMSVPFTWALAAKPEDAIEDVVVVATDGVDPRRVSTDWVTEDFRDLDFNSKLSRTILVVSPVGSGILFARFSSQVYYGY